MPKTEKKTLSGGLRGFIRVHLLFFNPPNLSLYPGKLQHFLKHAQNRKKKLSGGAEGGHQGASTVF